MRPAARRAAGLAFALGLAVLVVGIVPAWAGETVVYLVRHAEKAAAKGDPPLAPQGVERAEQLAHVLADAGLTAIHASATQRAQETADPVAKGQGLAVSTYDPADPAALVKALRAQGGRALVVGHSNTLGPLVAALGGEPGTAIEDDEYDRLYVLLVPEQGATTTLRLRYGRPR